MKTITKIWIIVAVSLIAIGVVAFTIGVSLNGGIEMNKYTTKTYDNLESFNDITINATTADINFLQSSDSKAKVVCYEEEKESYSVAVNDNKLTIELKSNKKWYEFISIGFKSPKITVYLPSEKYSEICIKLSTGDIDINGITAKNLNLTVTTGDIELKNATVENDINIKYSTGEVELENIKANNFTASGSTGDIDLNSVVLSDKMNITTSTGDVHFYRSDASEIKVKVTTGDVKGSLLSSKIFMVNTSTGKKQVPKTTEGGICEITTSTGDIIITIAN